MKLRWHTDYALRSLMYLAFVKRKAKVEEIAAAFQVSKDHLVKCVQELARAGMVRTLSGRSGGVELAMDPETIMVGDVVAALEGKGGVLDCVSSPEVCPLEPGCRLRKKLIAAEQAFFAVLADVSIASVVFGAKHGGMHNLTMGERD